MHTPGGSSGGSAAVVASGCCIAAIGSDTGVMESVNLNGEREGDGMSFLNCHNTIAGEIYDLK